MTNVLRSLVLAVAGLAAAATLASAKAVDDQRAAPPPSPDQQVLVLLRLPAEHFRPNSDYGGSYGDSAGRSARLRIATGIAHRYGVAVVSEWPMPILGVDCYVMAVPANQSAEDVAARLARDPGVSWTQPVHLYRGQGEPASHNDPLYRVQPAALEWDLADLHQVATGRNVRVAVVDSAIEKTHPDLVGQVEVSENFVTGRPETAESHGTGVAGIIAARSDNGIGIAGVAPQARLMGLRACWQEAPRPGAAAGEAATVCDSLSLAKAIDFAINHDAQIINLSLSGPPDLLLGKLLDVALARGLIVVGAYDRNLPGGGFPASHTGVVAVADESSGPPIAGVFGAPGRDVPTTQPGGRWFLVNGSSYAAAHVSGLFALVRERAPRAHAITLVVAHPKDTIDACATLLQAGPCNCSCPVRKRCWPSTPSKVRPASPHLAWTLPVILSLSPLAVARAHAQVAISVSAESDYRFRGVSLTHEQPDFKLDLSYDHDSGAYAGGSLIAGKAVHGGVQTLGYLAYVGFVKRTSSGLAWDVGATSSRIIDNIPSTYTVTTPKQTYIYYYTRHYHATYNEAYVGLIKGAVNAHLYFSPDYLGQGVSTAYLEINTAFQPAERVSLFWHVGLLTPLSGVTGPKNGREQYDLRAGVALSVPHGELQLAWTAVGAQVAYPIDYPQKRQAVIVSASAYS